MVQLKNTNAGMSAMVIKIGDTYIMPGETGEVDLSAVADISTVSLFGLKSQQQAEKKAAEIAAKKAAREAAGENPKGQYAYDPWTKNPCCICPPCAVFGPCLEDCVNPDNPLVNLLCLPAQICVGRLANPICIGHCKCCEICNFCLDCKCSCCPPGCTCCNIQCPPQCLLDCMPKCLSCCPPKCSWCNVQCPPDICFTCIPKCISCCPPKCEWCEITCPPDCPCPKCPPQCLLDCCAVKTIGCACIFCHGTCTMYPKCCPVCICSDETIKPPEMNKLIVKGKEDVTMNNTAGMPMSNMGGPDGEAMER